MFFNLYFILFSCSIIKTLAIIFNFANETDTVKYLIDRKWLIPTAIIIYFLARVFRAYTYSNEKYYFEKKVISIPNYMLIYGIYGLIISSICALISTYVPCGDDTIPELSKTVCEYKDNNGIYYFDSYKIFFDNLYSEQFAARLILLFVKSILQFFTSYFIYVIFQKLSPVYYLCVYRFNVLILYILGFINYLITNDSYDDVYIYTCICDILTLFFFIIGSVVYLEFIELNFCKLNFYTKRNIKERSTEETIISLKDIDANSELSLDEGEN